MHLSSKARLLDTRSGLPREGASIDPWRKVEPLCQRDLRGKRFLRLAEWRNWQTRRIQNPVLARECRFESDLGYRRDPCRSVT